MPAHLGQQKMLNGWRFLIKGENFGRKLIKRCCALSLAKKKSTHLQWCENSEVWMTKSRCLAEAPAMGNSRLVSALNAGGIEAVC